MQQYLKPGFTRLKNSLEKMVHTLEAIDENLLNLTPEPNKWSCAQILVHVNLSLAGTINYMNKKLQKPELIEKANMASWGRSKLLNLALKSNIKFKAPKGLDILPTNTPLATIKATTQQNIDNLSALLDAFPDDLLNKNVFKHPVAGRISITQTLAFLNVHTQRHQHQIEQIIKYHP